MSMIKVENLTFSYPSSCDNIFEDCLFEGIRTSRKTEGAFLLDNTFKNCNFSFAEIENMNFYKINFTNTLFTGARLANNTFLETSFIEVDLNGSTTKFNCFETSLWEKSIFGNCSIDYNIAINSKFVSSKMNLETLGSTWGLQESDLKDITFLESIFALCASVMATYKVALSIFRNLTDLRLAEDAFNFF